MPPPSQFNLISLTYLFSRLAPFIIICYFVLQSLFNQDLKGVFYIAGVLFSCLLNIFTINMFTPSITTQPAVCSAIDGMPNSPIGQTILGFTFGYLSFIIAKSNTVKLNIPTFVFFPVMIVFDFFWNLGNGCYGFPALVVALLLGGGFGALWGFIIWSVDKDLAIINGISNKEICNMPSKAVFRCKERKGA
jgi:hypothetical protein